jgi:quercetin dioxygenase-like cupin family protein
MPSPGDELVNSGGLRLVFEETADTTGGELVRVRAFHPPGTEEPIEHYHPFQEERFEVVAGEMTAVVDGRERVYGAGERFTVAPEAVHAMWNAGPAPAELLWETRPALKTGEFFERIWGLRGKPGPLEFAVIARVYDEEFRVVKPPRAVQRAVFPLLSVVGRLRGHRA